MEFRESSITALTDLGLNNLEANVYLALLKEPGTTGYRVGKTLGKAVSNVYQALELWPGRALLFFSVKAATEGTPRFLLRRLSQDSDQILKKEQGFWKKS